MHSLFILKMQLAKASLVAIHYKLFSRLDFWSDKYSSVDRKFLLLLLFWMSWEIYFKHFSNSFNMWGGFFFALLVFCVSVATQFTWTLSKWNVDQFLCVSFPPFVPSGQRLNFSKSHWEIRFWKIIVFFPLEQGP